MNALTRKINGLILPLLVILTSCIYADPPDKGISTLSENGKTNMLTVLLSSTHDTFMLGETIDITVSVKNTSAEDIIIPDFAITPNGNIYFELNHPDNTSEKLEDHGLFIRPINSPKHPVLTLTSDDKYTVAYRINEKMRFTQTGKYYLSANLKINDIIYISNAIQLSLAEKEMSGVDIAITRRKTDIDFINGEGIYILRGKIKQSIHHFPIFISEDDEEPPAPATHPQYENNSTLTIEQTQPIDEAFVLPGNEEDILTSGKSTIWRSGNKVHVFSWPNSDGAIWVAPLPSGNILNKPYRASSDTIELAVISGEGNTLWLLQATDTYSQSNNKIRLRWQAQLPVIADNAIIVTPETKAGVTRHLAIIKSKSNSYEIFHANYNEKKLGGFNSIEITDRQYIASIKPVAIVDDDQRMILATVAHRETSQGTGIILTVVGNTHDNKLEIITEKNIGYVKSPDAIEHGALLYPATANRYDLPVLVLHLTDGSMRESGDKFSEPVEADVSCSVVQPLKLTEKESQIYALCYSMKNGYILQPLWTK